MRLSLLLIFFTQVLIGQNISGVVLDSKTNAPIENVSIYFKKKTTGTTSKTNGTFNLNLKSKRYTLDTLEFSCIGYFTKKITIAAFTKANNTVYLSKKLENLDEVVVNSSKALNTKIKFKKLSALKSRVFAFGSQVVGNYIYVASGSSSYLEDSGKRALTEINELPNPSMADFLKALQRSFSYEGYSDKLQIYDIQNDTWSVSEIPFRKRAYHNLNCYGNTLYSLGGKRLSVNKKKEYLDDKIEVFDMASKDLIIDHTNPHQSINFASFTYKDNIIVMGGSTELKKNGEKVYTDAAHIFNITSGKWYELGKMRSAKETQGVIIDDIIYLVGGHNGNTLQTIESYNITTKTWTNEGDLFYDMETPALTSHEHIIYMFDEKRLLTYDTITKTLEAYKIDLELKNPELHFHQNKLYIVGGFLENSHTIAGSSDLYVVDVAEFAKAKPINSNRIN